ncbi:MAG TPA: matrixin family metalloprotease [Myxococcaceae bacterium]|nr:matrixin family metalloprotease [Myxococcaceae bacterium]
MRGAIAALALLLALPAGAQAIIGGFLDYKMLNTEANPFAYWMDARPNATPAHLSLDTVESVLKSAVQQWEDVSCASSAFEWRGRLTHPELTSTTDAYSVALIWVRDPSDPAYDQVLGGGVAVSASHARSYAGVLDTCDVFLNAVNFNWSVTATVPADHIDLRTALLHELGHCQGLDHNILSPEAVMGSDIPVGRAKQLNEDDRAHLCAWLPRSGQVGSPCTIGQSCGAADLTCVPPTDPSGYPFCSRPCGPEVDASCPDPFICAPSGAIDGASSICVPPAGQVVDVGAACETPDACGASQGMCRHEGPSATRPDPGTQWEGGYCTQACGDGGEVCPFGSVCEELSAGEERCVKTCRIGTSDCRDGYVCQEREGGRGVCEPRCSSNADCGANGVCRTCDGMCLEQGRPGASVGDVCSEDADCGTGQSCLGTEDGTGVCTQRCESACSACPAGTTCYSVGNERLCLRNCEEPRHCAAGLQCAPLESGGACFPACETDATCPVGNVCEAGQCTDPNATDGGCGALCGPDAGTPAPPVTPPAPVPQGGCGCQGAAAGLSAFGMLGVLFMLADRRRGHRA